MIGDWGSGRGYEARVGRWIQSLGDFGYKSKHGHLLDDAKIGGDP